MLGALIVNAFILSGVILSVVILSVFMLSGVMLCNGIYITLCPVVCIIYIFILLVIMTIGNALNCMVSYDRNLRLR